MLPRRREVGGQEGGAGELALGLLETPQAGEGDAQQVAGRGALGALDDPPQLALRLFHAAAPEEIRDRLDRRQRRVLGGCRQWQQQDRREGDPPAHDCPSLPSFLRRRYSSNSRRASSCRPRR